jgi:hypothetical protein
MLRVVQYNQRVIPPKHMRRKKAIILAIVAVGAIAYALLTGGLACQSRSDFGGQRDIRLVGGLKSDVWLEPDLSKVSIPFVGHYYGTAVPCGLRLQIWDATKTYSSISISEVVVAYTDGEAVRHSNPWSRQLRPYTQHNSSSSGIIKTEMMMLSDTIPSVVSRHTDARVTITGKLVTTSGEEVDFSASESFKAESGFDVTTFWEVLAGV